MSGVVLADVEPAQEASSQEVVAYLPSHGLSGVQRGLLHRECFRRGQLLFPALPLSRPGILASPPKPRPKRGNFKRPAKLLKRASELTGEASRRTTLGTSVQMQRTTGMGVRLPTANLSQDKW